MFPYKKNSKLEPSVVKIGAELNPYLEKLIDAMRVINVKNYNIARDIAEDIVAFVIEKNLRKGFIDLALKFIESLIFKAQGNYVNYSTLILECYFMSKGTNDVLESLVGVEYAHALLDEGKLETARKLLSDQLDQVDGDGQLELVASWEIYTGLADISNHTGNITKALHYVMQASEIAKGIRNKEYLGKSLTNIGIQYMHLGEFDLSYRFYEHSFDVYERMKDEQGMAVCQGNKAIIHMYRGQREEALAGFEIPKNYFSKNNDPITALYWRGNIAKLHIEQGDYLMAKVFLEENIALINFYDIKHELLYPYFDYFMTALQLELRDEMQDSFHKIQEIAVSNPSNTKILSYYYLCQALILKNEKRALTNKWAIEILDFITSDGFTTVELLYLAIINKCEIHLAELEINENVETISKIQALLEYLVAISLKGKIYPLLIYTKILSAQFLAITGKFQESLDLIAEAIQIAIDQGLENLAREAKSQKENVSKEIGMLYDRILTNRPIQDRIQEIDLDEYLDRIKNFRLIK